MITGDTFYPLFLCIILFKFHSSAFIHGLKQTGMKIEDIVSFTEEGCHLKQEDEENEDLPGTLQNCIAILDQFIAEDKRSFYTRMLQENVER